MTSNFSEIKSHLKGKVAEGNLYKPHKPELRLQHEIFYRYSEFLRNIHRGFPESSDAYVDSTTFKDGTWWLKTVVGRRGRESDLETFPRYKAIIPFWISSQFGDYPSVILSTKLLINSVTHTERHRKSVVDFAVGVSPYMEVREDQDGKGEYRNREVGEAINAEELAKDLNRLKKLAVLGIHSYESMSYFKKEGIKMLNITAAPLFAEHIREHVFTRKGLTKREEKKRIDPENTRIVALDKGSLQQCVHLANLLGMDLSKHIVAFDKTRKGQNVVDESMLIYGSAEDIKGKDIIIYDDVIDTFGSIQKTCLSLREKGCKSITVIATHGVFSYPGRQNVIDALEPNGNKTPIVDRIIMTDSLQKLNIHLKNIT